MRKISTILAVTAMLAIGPTASLAETGDLGMAIKAGTLGVGVELSYPVTSFVTLGVGVNSYSSGRTSSTDGIDYDVDLTLKTVSFLLNFRPFAGSFHLTGGVMLNSNELSLKADPAANYAIGDLTYGTLEVGKLEATVDFRKAAPYAGFGWGGSSSSGIGFSLDIGVLMQGKPNVEFKSTGGTLSNDAAFLAELAKEESNAEDDIKGFTMYPVVSAGLNFRF